MEHLILDAIESYGLIAIFMMMTTNGFLSAPPSEAVYGFAGVLIALGKFHFSEMFFYGVMGNLIGTTILYSIGRHYGFNWLVKYREEHKHLWIARLIPSSTFFAGISKLLSRKEGMAYIAVLRCLPMIRSIVSLPAGMIKMPAIKFIICTLFGCCAWAIFWLYLGIIVGKSWQSYSLPISASLTVILIMFVLYLKSRISKLIKIQMRT